MKLTCLLLVLLTLSVSSCSGYKNDLPFADSIRRTNIKQLKTTPGKTTIAEVESVLGKPDRHSHNISTATGMREDSYVYFPTWGWYSIELTSCVEGSETDCTTYSRNAKEHYFLFKDGVLVREPTTVSRGPSNDLN